MKVKLGEIFNTKEVLAPIFSASVKPKLAYQLAKLNEKLFAELLLIDKYRANLVITKYGIKDDQETSTQPGANYKVPKENLEAFSEEFGTFLEEETDVTTDPISYELFIEADLKITARAMSFLTKFLTKPVTS